MILALPLLPLVLSGAAMLFKDTVFVPADWRAPREAPRHEADAELVRLMTMPGLQAVEAVQLARGNRAFPLVSGLLLAFNPPVRAWLNPFADPRAVQAPGGVALDFAEGDAAASIAALRRVFPQGAVTQLVPLAGGSGTQWSLKLRLPGEGHPNGRSNVILDVAAGRIVALRDARLAGVPAASDDMLYPLHIGALFGDGQRVLWLLGGIGLLRLVTAGVTALLRRPPARGASPLPAPV